LATLPAPQHPWVVDIGQTQPKVKSENPASLAIEVYLKNYLKVILTYEKTTLDKLCTLAVWHRQNSSLSRASGLIILI
tara:strand:- start:258 stop:491 length:234 start_codon:yes stop_codon:yes gene_type:complete